MLKCLELMIQDGGMPCTRNVRGVSLTIPMPASPMTIAWRNPQRQVLSGALLRRCWMTTWMHGLLTLL